jgi:hypothetical protein
MFAVLRERQAPKNVKMKDLFPGMSEPLSRECVDRGLSRSAFPSNKWEGGEPAYHAGVNRPVIIAAIWLSLSQLRRFTAYWSMLEVAMNQKILISACSLMLSTSFALAQSTNDNGSARGSQIGQGDYGDKDHCDWFPRG